MHSLLKLSHFFCLEFVRFFFNFLLYFILVSLIKFWRDTPRETTFNCQSKVTLARIIFLNQSLLTLRSCIKQPELFHAFHSFKVLAVKVLALTDSVFDAF